MPRLALVVLLLTAFAGAQQPAPAERPLTIEAIFAEGGITGRGPETVKWSPDGTKVSFVQRDDAGERGALYYVDLATGKPAVLVAQEKLATLVPPTQALDEREKERRSRYSVAAYHWAPDSQHILFDSHGQLWLYSLQTGTAVQITASNEASGDPKFSPDGSKIAFVRAHDLYVYDHRRGREKRLTKDGSEDLLNGEVDWVYAEELDVRSNYFWSPDGRRILFLQMDEKPVPTYPITDWIPTRASVDMQKYPKAGDDNPKVRLGVISAGGGKVKWLALPEGFEYIPRFGWLDANTAWVQTLNRAQDRLDLYFVDARSGRALVMLREESDAWVEVNNDFKLLQSGQFLWSSWRSGHTHLYLYSFDAAAPLARPAKLERQLTSGDFEVFGVEAVDEAGGRVYFISNQGDARQRQLYSVKLDGTGLERVTQEKGTHGVTFAPDAKHFVDSFSALMTPPRAAVCRVGGSCATFWDSRPVTGFDLIPPQFVDFRAEDGTVLHGTLTLPKKTTGKVALILRPYGGPGGQVSRDAWGGTTFLFHQLLARDGFAVLEVDNRGMGARGKKFAAALKRNFGTVEVQDQLAALDQALAQFPQLDGSRVGFWGWSYGGFMTLQAMTHSDRFRAGVSVAPVTDWRDYDTIYTERYMATPQQNPEGYRKGSPVHFAKDLSGALLLVHGTSDDNVHLQNTVQMSDELIKAGKQFDLMLYPRKTHGIAGAAARTHLFHRIRSHFRKQLAAPPAQCQ